MAKSLKSQPAYRVTCGMDFDFATLAPFSATNGLIGLFIGSFLAATLLPGGSEALFFVLVTQHPDRALSALALATLGNTLGGMSSYALAFILPQKISPDKTAMLRRYGPSALALAWLPLIGDAMAVAAGWLRLSWWRCALWMLLGKGLRYAVILIAL